MFFIVCTAGRVKYHRQQNPPGSSGKNMQQQQKDYNSSEPDLAAAGPGRAGQARFADSFSP